MARSMIMVSLAGVPAVRPAGPSRLATYFHVHLVSDSTGETLNAMAKAVTARFDGVIPIEHIYALVRSDKQMERVLEEIAAAPGVVLHTIVDRDLRAQLEEGCRALDMPQIAALDPLVGALSRYLGAALSTRVGRPARAGHTTISTASRRWTTPWPTTTARARPNSWRAPTSSWCGCQPDLQDPDLHLSGPPRRPRGQCAAGAGPGGRRTAGRAEEPAGRRPDRLARPAGADPPQPAGRAERGPRVAPMSTTTPCATRRSRRAAPSSGAAGRSSTSPAARSRRRRRRSSTCSTSAAPRRRRERAW